MTETPILTFKIWKFFKIKPDSRKYSTILLIQPITSWRNILFQGKKHCEYVLPPVSSTYGILENCNYTMQSKGYESSI
ncbi:hypothetical protein CEXT_296361 [Caerostris extrusa]|uniref:Uncharacterized protein n=1 Tax=Caerostris extrusa TaxID=172846 RepID=A0AAV4UAZ5_CAEEX|nr:hypothetical protein CEXT_296361 [Caerostris extrusa]